MAFQDKAFFSTHGSFLVFNKNPAANDRLHAKHIKKSRNKVQLATISQAIYDRSNVSAILNCSQYVEEKSEDQCLRKCLVRRFLSEFREDSPCIHPRLVLSALDDPELLKELSNESVCEYDAVKPEDDGMEDSGMTKIRDLLAEFRIDSASESRCWCPSPCVVRTIKIQPYAETEGDEEDPHQVMVWFVVSYCSLENKATCL